MRIGNASLKRCICLASGLPGLRHAPRIFRVARRVLTTSVLHSSMHSAVRATRDAPFSYVRKSFPTICIPTIHGLHPLGHSNIVDIRVFEIAPGNFVIEPQGGRRDMRLFHPWTARGCASWSLSKIVPYDFARTPDLRARRFGTSQSRRSPEGYVALPSMAATAGSHRASIRYSMSENCSRQFSSNPRPM